TPRMFERLHKALGWGCKILGVDEPELYVMVDPTPNAFTYGHTRPFIVLTSGLVDMLDDEERFFVIAHELGHIKAAHVLYTGRAPRVVDGVMGGALSDSLDNHVPRVNGKRLEITRIGGEDGAAWFSERHHQRIDGRPSTSETSQQSRATRDRFWYGLGDFAGL